MPPCVVPCVWKRVRASPSLRCSTCADCSMHCLCSLRWDRRLRETLRPKEDYPMHLSKRCPRTQQPRLLFVDENQAELWSRLSLEQQELCQNLLSQLLRQIVSQPDNAC